MKGSESMSEATIAITKLRQDKLNPHYRPMIFVIAPFTEVVKSDAKSTMTVRSYCRFIYQHGGIPVCPQLYLPQFINMHHSREFQVAAFINIVLLTKCAEAWSFGKPTHDMRYFIRLAKRKNKNIRYFNNEMEAN
ncbi:hypothetical protein GBP19_04790 [Pediococcus acidilactici]|jgi:hypothetical protein|nr:hypothetical protein HMPREF0538_20475 [Limosilactobacillus reuteri SD2112]EEI65818.1 hypothetical protein HMPREF0534_0859 [Limosilactobacillus reuteri CF48-3A]KAF0499749.1 hypothetical protein GBP19_04790 [Pediococcus acidilactici]MBS7688256.1 hypothetical protein [Limosilactobacillus fermentum]MBU5983537.1 hypothetical protein [Limosilactobacillus reuteri]QFG73023.1 hypothetical protein LF145_06705 [Limosilactobacillus frumenti]